MKNILIVFSFLFSTAVIAQEKPVTFEIAQSGDTLVFNANIQNGWHLYAVNMPDPTAGPLPTEFIFNESNAYQLVGSIIESKGHTELDEVFGVDVTFFSTDASFKQVIQNTSFTKPTVSGTIYYMACNDESCTSFDYPFSWILK